MLGLIAFSLLFPTDMEIFKYFNLFAILHAFDKAEARENLDQERSFFFFFLFSFFLLQPVGTTGLTRGTT